MARDISGVIGAVASLNVKGATSMWQTLNGLPAQPTWWLTASLLTLLGGSLGWWLPWRLQRIKVALEAEATMDAKAGPRAAATHKTGVKPIGAALVSAPIPFKQRVVWACSLALLGLLSSLGGGFSAGWGGLGFGVWALLLFVIAVIDQRFLVVEAWPVLLGLLLHWLGLAWLTPWVLQSSILAALAGAGGLYLVGFTHVALRGRLGLGEGDGAIFALVCAHVGLAGAPLALGLAAVLGLVFSLGRMLYVRKSPTSQGHPPLRWNTPLPLGPCFFLGAVLTRLAQIHGIVGF